MHRFNSRLRRLEAQADKDESPDGPGLAALLAWASRHSQAEHDAWEDDEAAAPTGLTALLAEARRWLEHRDQDIPLSLS